MVRRHMAIRCSQSRSASLLVIGALVLFHSVSAHATVKYVAVNHVTRQWTVLETGDLYYPIGWHGIGEDRNLPQQLGYSKTDFPYFVESVLLTVFLASIAGAIGLLITRKQASNKKAAVDRLSTM